MSGISDSCCIDPFCIATVLTLEFYDLSYCITSSSEHRYSDYLQYHPHVLCLFCLAHYQTYLFSRQYSLRICGVYIVICQCYTIVDIRLGSRSPLMVEVHCRALHKLPCSPFLSQTKQAQTATPIRDSCPYTKSPYSFYFRLLIMTRDRQSSYTFYVGTSNQNALAASPHTSV